MPRARRRGRPRPAIAPRDAERDQSYFLFATTREQLEFLRFPLGDLTKAEVRALARRFGLAVADKPDSQDICFVPSGRYADVIERLRPGAAAAGDIVDLDGRVLGRHDGIIHFTVGQRRGLGIAAGRAALRRRLDAEQPPRDRRPARGAAHDARAAARLNWIGDGTVEAALAAGPLDVFVKVRSTRPPRPATLARSTDGFEVELAGGEEGVAPGQACVLYDSADGQARMLGGGFIGSAVSQGEIDVAAALRPHKIQVAARG